VKSLLPTKHLKSVESKLQSHMNEQGLGTPLELNLPIKATLDKILSMQGAPLSEGEISFQQCIQEIQKVVLSSSKKELSTSTGANNNNSNMSDRERLLLDANSKLKEEISSLRLEVTKHIYCYRLPHVDNRFFIYYILFIIKLLV
jgi:hypothetical protein